MGIEFDGNDVLIFWQWTTRSKLQLAMDFQQTCSKTEAKYPSMRTAHNAIVEFLAGKLLLYSQGMGHPTQVQSEVALCLVHWVFY